MHMFWIFLDDIFGISHQQCVYTHCRFTFSLLFHLFSMICQFLSEFLSLSLSLSLFSLFLCIALLILSVSLLFVMKMHSLLHFLSLFLSYPLLFSLSSLLSFKTNGENPVLLVGWTFGVGRSWRPWFVQYSVGEMWRGRLDFDEKCCFFHYSVGEISKAGCNSLRGRCRFLRVGCRFFRCGGGQSWPHAISVSALAPAAFGRLRAPMF